MVNVMSQRACGICGQTESKYKCVNCKVPSCSLECFRNHKAKCSAVITTTQTSTPVAFAAGEQVSSKTTNISTHNELEELFKRFPQLRSQLHDIYSVTLDPAKRIPNQSGRGVDSGSLAQRPDRPAKSDRGWTPDKGLGKGVTLLQAMISEGQSAEALQEFLKLLKPSGSGLNEPSPD